MFMESTYDYLCHVKPENYTNPYVKKRIGQFERQILELRKFADKKQGKIHDILLSKVVKYECLLDRLANS